jgi:drug/metabolite transporter (DMT)-like permease
VQKENSRSYFVGVIEMTIANSFVGVNIILNKFLVGKAPLLLLLELRYLFGVLILFMISLFMKNKFSFYLNKEKFTNKDWLVYILMALSGGVFFNFIYMCGMDKTTATSVGIIGSSIPTIIAIFSFIFLKQSLKRVHLVSIILVVVGVLILNISKFPSQGMDISSGIDSTTMLIGNLIVFLAMIPEALFTIFAKMIKIKVCPVISGLLINLLNALVCLPFALYSLNEVDIFKLEPIIWLFSFCVGLFSGALFYVFYNKGISKIDSNTAALMTGVIPISAAFLAILFLNEPFHINTFLGMLCVLFSIYIGVRFRESSKVLIQRVRQK